MFTSGKMFGKLRVLVKNRGLARPTAGECFVGLVVLFAFAVFA